MNRKISLGAALALIIIAVALTVSITMVIAMRNFDYNISKVSERQAMFDYITDVDKEVRQNFLGEINEDRLRASLANGYIKGIGDPYAAYLTADEYRKETDRLAGKKTGFGIEITQFEDGSIVISSVHKNSAADKAGLKKGDVITQFDGKNISAYSFAVVSSRLEKSQKIKLSVSRGKDSIAFELTSSSYTITSVESRMIDTTGYIRITGFYSNTPDQFKNAYTSLESQGAENYIFDVRYNKGGDLTAAGEIISYLAPRGAYARKTEGDATTDLVSTGAYEITKPSVTLVNKATEGEAELFAGVLQELKKTTVVGEKTFGRGKVQKFFTLVADGAAIKLSVASLSLIVGGEIESVGITPNVSSEMPDALEKRFSFLNEENDPQMIAAIAVLKGGMIAQTTTQPFTPATTGTTVADTASTKET